MAATSRRTAASLEEDLLRRGHEFSYHQAMRLLSMLAQAGEEEGITPTKVRIRPELSLAFPCADLAGVEKGEEGYLVQLSLFGLYGQASPLPTFYTEQLLDEASAEVLSTRHFIDILNH